MRLTVRMTASPISRMGTSVGGWRSIPLGIKGVGESGIVSPAGVIAGAVEDALWDRGVRVTRVPVTSARIFELLRAAGAA